MDHPQGYRQSPSDVPASEALWLSPQQAEGTAMSQTRKRSTGAVVTDCCCFFTKLNFQYGRMVVVVALGATSSYWVLTRQDDTTQSMEEKNRSNATVWRYFGFKPNASKHRQDIVLSQPVNITVCDHRLYKIYGQSEAIGFYAAQMTQYGSLAWVLPS